MSVFGDCAIIFCHIQDIWPLDYSRSDSMSLESMLGPRVCLQVMMFHTLGSEAWIILCCEQRQLETRQ